MKKKSVGCFSGLGFSLTSRQRDSFTVPLTALGVGTVIGLVGYENRAHPMGLIAIGTGGSMVATGLVLLLSALL